MLTDNLKKTISELEQLAVSIKEEKPYVHTGGTKYSASAMTQYVEQTLRTLRWYSENIGIPAPVSWTPREH